MKKALITLSLLLATSMSHATETIKVGIAAEPYPPFSTKNADGTWEGFEVDILNKLCDEAALECEIRDIAWDGIIPALLSNKIDVIFTSMSITEERAKKVLFTKPYYNTLPVIIGQKGQTFSIDEASLDNKIIGAQTSTISSFYIQGKAGKYAEIREYGTQDEVNSDLLAGRIDYMIADGIGAIELYKAHKDILENYGDVEYDASLGQGIGAAVRQSDTKLEAKLSAAIESVVHSDFYNDLSMKYFGLNVAPK
jgi:polar amino acid transport system substrate-binding protein